MVADMQFEDGTVLRLRAPEPQGVPAVSLMPGLGAHRLAVRLEVEPVSVADSVNQAVLSGQLRAADGAGWIGSFLPAGVALRSRASTVAVDLVVPVPSAQLLALEEHRNGADLALMLDVEGTLPQSVQHPSAVLQDHRQVAASVWEQQLEQLGLAVSFTVTIPLPQAAGRLRTAAEHLRAADRQITAGEYPDAIRETRLAVSLMRDLCVWPGNVSKRRDDQDQSDRFGVLLDRLAAQADGYAGVIQAVFNQASGPQHNDGAIAGAAWLRADAITLNAIAAALLHRIAAEVA